MKVTDWIIACHNSDGDETYLCKLFGDENDVRKAIANSILWLKEQNDANWDEDCCYTETENIEDNDGVLYGYAMFYDHHVDYTAYQLDNIKSFESGREHS